MEFVTPEEAVAGIRSGDRVYVHTAAAAPSVLIHALTQRYRDLSGVEMVHLHTEGEAPYAAPEYEDHFFTRTFFTGRNMREAVKNGRADYIPIFLSEIPRLFHQKVIPLDAALIQVSPPDRHGFCSLGISVDATRAALLNAERVIAQVNPQMPRIHGDGLIHRREIDLAIETDQPIAEHFSPELTDVERQIGRHCASRIENGATLQMGIGSIPDAVLAALDQHRNLGIHTEMFSDGLLPLIESGVVNNSQKRVHPGKVVSSFAMGTRRFYEYLDDNPLFQFLDCAYVNDSSVIRRNPRVTAVNSAIEIDLTGQVCADSIGTMQYSGVGGQMDFIRGASLSDGGRPMIAMPSITRHGESKIVPHLKTGAGVVTTRAHVHDVVTEYGVAELYGKSIRQRAMALIEIAHPDHREALMKAARERFHTGFD